MPSFDANAMTSFNIFQAKIWNCQFVDFLPSLTSKGGKAESRPSKLELYFDWKLVWETNLMPLFVETANHNMKKEQQQIKWEGEY